MSAYRLPGATCGEEQMLVLDDGTSCLVPSQRPGAVNGAHAFHASEWDPRTVMRRAAGVKAALERAAVLAPAAVWAETQVQLGALIDALLPGLLMALGALGASVALGGAGGAAIGALAGGVGAVPGAALGAGVGLDVGVAALTWMGLALLIPPIVNGLGELTSIVSQATTTAWDAFGRADRDSEIERSAGMYAHAVAVLLRLILIAIVIRLTAGQVGGVTSRALGSVNKAGKGAPAAAETTAELIATLRSSRLGKGFADWVEAHAAELKANPRLQPRRASPPVTAGVSRASTPAQSRAAGATQMGKASQSEVGPGVRSGSKPKVLAEAEAPALGRQSQRVLDQYQKAYDDAAAAFDADLHAGNIKQPEGLNFNTWRGSRIDAIARAEMNAWKKLNGADELVVNRRLQTPEGIKSYRVPDLLLPEERTVIDGTIGYKDLSTPQIQDFFSSGKVDRVVLVRPNQEPIIILNPNLISGKGG